MEEHKKSASFDASPPTHTHTERNVQDRSAPTLTEGWATKIKHASRSWGTKTCENNEISNFGQRLRVAQTVHVA